MTWSDCLGYNSKTKHHFARTSNDYWVLTMVKKQNPLRFILLRLILLQLYRDWSEILLLRSDDRQIHISSSHSSTALCIFYSHQGPWAKAQHWGPVMTPSFVPWLKPHRVLLHSAGSHEAFPSSHQEAWEPADRSTRQPRHSSLAKTTTNPSHTRALNTLVWTSRT